MSTDVHSYYTQHAAFKHVFRAAQPWHSAAATSWQHVAAAALEDFGESICLGTADYIPILGTNFCLNDWQQITSLPQNSLGPHSQSQQWTDLALLDSFLPSSTSSDPPPEAGTASHYREFVDGSEIQDTDLPPK